MGDIRRLVGRNGVEGRRGNPEPGFDAKETSEQQQDQADSERFEREDKSQKTSGIAKKKISGWWWFGLGQYRICTLYGTYCMGWYCYGWDASYASQR